MRACMACFTSTPLLALLILLVFSSDRCATGISSEDEPSFDQNYQVTWGGSHVSYASQGREIHLSMDKSSGAGFGSKLNYSSGFFHLKIKVPSKNTCGVVTAYYLHSHTSSHDELDFEFLGDKEGKPITLQTNVFINGYGMREQRIHLWFDPTADFHDYKILWNPYHIVFYVDTIPIRVFRNLTGVGVEYPTQPMRIEGSIWDGSDWATDGGKSKVNWDYAPFTSQFQGFSVDACSASDCSSPGFWWNRGRYKELTPDEKAAYQNVREKYVTYDYCYDPSRFHILPPECIYALHHGAPRYHC